MAASSTSQPPSPPSRWSRIVAIARPSLLVIVFAVLAAFAGVHILRTYYTADVQGDLVRQRQQENTQKREEIARREARVRELGTEQGIRDEARRTDMVLPGEHRVEVNYDVPAAPAAQQPASPWPLAIGAFVLAVAMGIAIAWLTRRRRRKRRPGILATRQELRATR